MANTRPCVHAVLWPAMPKLRLAIPHTPMKPRVLNNYAGEILHLVFPGDAPLQVQLNGYAETNTVRIHYVTSPFWAVTNGTLAVKLPHDLPPSFSSKNFKIWYECVIALDQEVTERSRFEVVNNPLQTDSFVGMVHLERIEHDDVRGEYNRAKQRIAELILKARREGIDLFHKCAAVKQMAADKNMEVGDEDAKECTERERNGLADAEFDDQIKDSNNQPASNQSEEENKREVEYEKEACYESSSVSKSIWQEIGSIQGGISFPVFPECDIPEIKEEHRKIHIKDEWCDVADIFLPAAILPVSFPRILYHRNTKATEITIYRHQYERGSLVDLDVAFHKVFNSSQCLERVFQMELSGYSIKNFLFEIKYTLNLAFDKVEVSMPLTISCPTARRRYLQ